MLTLFERKFDLWHDLAVFYILLALLILILFIFLSDINNCRLYFLDILKHRVFIEHPIESLPLYLMLPATQCIVQPSQRDQSQILELSRQLSVM